MDRLTALKTFVEIVEAGSFTAAAARLSSGPSAVTKRLLALEGSLGVRLLHRTTHGVALTDEGEICLERARRVLEEMDGIEQQLAGRHERASGELRVAVPAAMGQVYLLPHLSRFLSAHPAVSLRLEYEDGTPDLVRGRFDLAIRIGEPQDGRLVARRLARSWRVTCATPAYLARHAEPTDLAQLRGHACITLLRDGRRRVWRFRRGEDEVRFLPPAGLTVNSGVALRGCVLDGLGVVQCNSILVAPELGNGVLRAVLPDLAVPSDDLYVVYPSNRHAVPRVGAFLRFLLDVFRPYGRQDGAA
ncbi:LysR family transcriptional regulator [Muricoccus vinaceus]|uniref:LysR family transcriptional regulator n=1 Tax=Muricoccus vinaceus TaxID=424704 RepID=A0ABV6INN1_9PROT